MALFHRRDVPPRDALTGVPRTERVVSWADVAGGGVVLATPTGLWWPTGGPLRLIGWQYVSKAVWHGHELIVTEASVLDDLLIVDGEPIQVGLSRPRDLPPTVRARVEANVVHSQVLPVAGGRARCVARRVPGQDGVQWWARLEPGTADTPHVREAVRMELTGLREAWEQRTSAQR